MSVAESKTEKLEGWNRPHEPVPDSGNELLEVAMGPHHPSTHGVFRMDVTLDGERIVRLKPVFGYLHRNHEQLGEGQTYLASMPYTDRLDYFCSLTNNWAYALAVEKLAGLEAPERAQYLRVILAELTRIQNHACAVGFLIQDMGASGTPLMYAFKAREKILDLFEELTGSRMMCDYMRFGGCRVDASADWLDGARKVVAGLPQFVDEFEALLTSNEILMARCQGIGVLQPELAVNAGVTGPMLRASGVNYDIRKVDHYGIYDRFNFQRAAGRSLGRLRPIHDPAAGGAAVDQDSRAGAQRRSCRAGDGCEGKDSRFPAQARRSLWPHRGSEGRIGLLSDQRRRTESLPLPGAPAELYQFDDSGRYVPGTKRGRRRADPGQRGYCVGRSGSVKQGLRD